MKRKQYERFGFVRQGGGVEVSYRQKVERTNACDLSDTRKQGRSRQGELRRCGKVLEPPDGSLSGFSADSMTRSQTRFANFSRSSGT